MCYLQGTLHLAEQVKDSIMTSFPRALGARKRDIMRHIQYHVLSPQVRMASTIRSLMGMAESVRRTIHSTDPDTGEISVDAKQGDLYLKVVHQIMTAYKTDPQRMLFSRAPNRAGHGDSGK